MRYGPGGDSICLSRRFGLLSLHEMVSASALVIEQEQVSQDVVARPLV